MLVGVAFHPSSFPPSRTKAIYIIKRQNCVYFCNTVYLVLLLYLFYILNMNDKISSIFSSFFPCKSKYIFLQKPCLYGIDLWSLFYSNMILNHNNLELIRIIMISLFIQCLDKLKTIPKIFSLSKVIITFVGILVEIALLRTYCNNNKHLLIKSNKNLIKSKGIIVDNCNWLHPFWCGKLWLHMKAHPRWRK